VLAAFPLAIILAITVAEWLTPERVRLSPLLVAAPAIAACFGGPGFTILVSVIIVIDRAVLAVHDGTLRTPNSEIQLLAMIVTSAFLVLFSFFVDRHRRTLRRVRLVSEAAQLALLRPLPAQLGPIRLASTYLAAQEEAQIGGDLYAAIRMKAGTWLFIGDVRGKGMSSVSYVALLLGAFREAAWREVALADMTVLLDDRVRANLDGHATHFEHGAADDGERISENFVTAAVLEIPDDGSQIHLIDCGHPPALLIRDHHVSSLQVENPAPPLGLGELGEPGSYEVETFAFEPGDTILLYTDGVIEARGPDGAFYPLAERVSAWRGDGGPETLVAFVRDDLLSYVGGSLNDDAAVVAVQRRQT
jgi:serine phosphatase RsbU (regulator of sigma subunit)